jgi:hypothetical protein
VTLSAALWTADDVAAFLQVPVATLYQWRHHLFIHAGASVKTVQLALGQSTPTIPLNEYVHEWPDVLDRTRALVDGALGKRGTAATPAGSRA